jgi:hypothetical protein
MRTLKVAASAFALCAVGFLLSGCGSGGKTYVPVIKQTGTFTVEVDYPEEELVGRPTLVSPVQTVGVGNTTSYAVYITGSDNFTGTVQLSVEGLDLSSFSVVFDDPSVVLDPDDEYAETTLWVTPKSTSVADGNERDFTVVGTSGGLRVPGNLAGIIVPDWKP